MPSQGASRNFDLRTAQGNGGHETQGERQNEQSTEVMVVWRAGSPPPDEASTGT